MGRTAALAQRAYLQREMPDGGLVFLVQGPLGDGPYCPFPFQVLCAPQPDGTFVAAQGPAYFPVAATVQFGSKPGEVLTSLAKTSGGLKFVFGAGASSGNFYADYTSVPPTTITYDAAQNALALDFSSTTLGAVSGLSSMQSQDEQSVSAAQTSGVQNSVELGRARFRGLASSHGL